MVRRMELAEFREILQRHNNWLRSGCVNHNDNSAPAVFEHVDLTDAINDYIWSQDKQLCLTRCTFYNVRLPRVRLHGVDISWSQFQDCDLSATHLVHAKLHDSLFSNCELVGAYVYYSDFSDCRLTKCNVKLAEFEYCNFNRSDWYDTDFDNTRKFVGCSIVGVTNHEYEFSCVPMCRLDFGVWPVTITRTMTQIGCQKRPNEFWLTVEDGARELDQMNSHAIEWWRKYGTAIKAAIQAVQTTVKHQE